MSSTTENQPVVVRLEELSNQWSDLEENQKKKTVGRFVGPSKKAVDSNEKLRRVPSLRNSVIGPSWTNYKMWKKETKFEGDDPSGLKVEILFDDEGLYAQITCESEEMCKLVRHNLLKYQTSFKMKTEKKIMNLFMSLDHSKLGLLIGRSGSGVRALQEEACNQMDEDLGDTEISKCRSAFVRVSDFVPKDFEDFKTMVEGSNRHDFIGWGCGEADEIIKVNISCNVSDETFTNFVECLSDALSTRVSEINDRSRDYDEKRKSDFEEIMGVIDQE